MKRLARPAAFMLAASLCVSCLGADSHVIVDLGDLGGSFGRARAVNAHGLVVGEALLPVVEIVQRAVAWDAGGVSDLGTLGGLASNATSVNNAGTVGGWAQDSGGRGRPVIWEAGGVRELPLLGGDAGAVWGLNDAGEAVGNAGLGAGVFHATLWSGPVITDLGTLGGDYSVAYDINDTGLIVGSAADATGRERAVRWEGGIPTDLGALSGGQWTAARAVGDEGELILWGKPEGVAANRAAFWSGDVAEPVIDLGTFGGLESWAFGLNNLGSVVGWAGTTDGAYHAFVWDGSGLNDLGTLGGLYSAAYGINDQGVIVGAAHDAGGVTHAVAWIPVPEPSPSLLLALGSLLLCATRKPRVRAAIPDGGPPLAKLDDEPRSSQFQGLR